MMLIWTLLSRWLAPLTLIGAIAAYLYSPAFLIFRSSFLWLFAATMFALGVVLQPEEARDALQKPSRIALGVATQFSVMPLLGFAAASIAVSQGVSPMLALGFIIVGCAPGAMASNVITFHYIRRHVKLSLWTGVFSEKSIFIYPLFQRSSA